ncbi:MAG: AAA family ATPase [Candidatus Cloacimonadaceae bacterium]|nr:AAA family ATPase [Candidatus Cloacimonadaceae bacterium]
MKQNQLVKISNVVEADQCINYLMNRPKMEMVGLGLIYGRPGLGKTTYAQRMAFQRGYIYLRLEATSTPKSFAVNLLTALYQRFELGSYIPSGTTNNIFSLCMQILDEHEEMVIVIDEIDYAFQQDKLLGAIRDIVDETMTVVILVGMQNAKDRLSQINEYYFDRCNSFYEFKQVDRKDIKLLAKEVLEVEVTEAIVDRIHTAAKGNLRKAMKMMHSIETGGIRMEESPTKIIDLTVAK